MEFDDLDLQLKDLQPKVREKALEIAKKQQEEYGLSEKEAIKKGIALAEEWFFNMEG